jgi:hypothetical protein
MKTGGAGTGSRTFQAYRNGAVSGASGLATVNSEANNISAIGSTATLTPAVNEYFTGTIQELVVFRNTTNDVSKIQNNQFKRFKIT